MQMEYYNKLKELKMLSDDAWKHKDYEYALGLNKQALELDPTNLLWVVNSMSNALLIKDLAQGKQFYLHGLDLLKHSKNTILFLDGRTDYLLPWKLQQLYITSLMHGHYFEEAALELRRITDFYCEAGFLRGNNSSSMQSDEFLHQNRMPRSSELEYLINEVRNTGITIPSLLDAINEYHDNMLKLNTKLLKLIDLCHQQKSYTPIVENYNGEGMFYVIDKRIDFCNIYFKEYPIMNSPDSIVSGAGVYSERAILVYTSIEELLSYRPFAIPRLVTMKEIFGCLKGSYGEIVINPSSPKYIAIVKNIVESMLQKSNPLDLRL